MDATLAELQGEVQFMAHAAEAAMRLSEGAAKAYQQGYARACYEILQRMRDNTEE